MRTPLRCKPRPTTVQNVWRLAAVTACLLLLTPHPAPAAGGAELKLEVAAGDTGIVKFPIRNGCASAHKFKLKAKKLPRLSFAEKGSPIVVGPGQTHTVELRFDTTRRKPGRYEGALFLGCRDCKKDRRCQVENQRFSVRVTVTAALDLARLARRLRKAEARFQAARPAAKTPNQADEVVRRTGEDVEVAFDEVDRRDELGALEDWAIEELRQVRQELSVLDSTTWRLDSRRPVAVVAALAHAAGAIRAAAVSSASEGRVEGLLGRVQRALNELIELIESNDLVVDLAVASTPEQGAWFQLFRLRESEPSAERPTDGVVEKVRRGLYRYRLHHAGHGAIEARLDLVRDARPLCCRLVEGVCYPLSLTEACHGSQGN